MNNNKRIWIKAFILFVVLLHIGPLIVSASQPATVISEWQMKWIASEPSNGSSDRLLPDHSGWFQTAADQSEQPPEDTKGAWITFKLPDLAGLKTAGLYISDLSSQNIEVYIQGDSVYSSYRHYPYARRALLIQLPNSASNQQVLIYLQGNPDKLSIHKPLVIGSYDPLNEKYLHSVLIDVVLGSAITIIAVIMLCCLLFLHKSIRPSWGALSLVILSIGLLIISNTCLPYTDDGSFGALCFNLFDLSSNILLPTFCIFFEIIFGKGFLSIIAHLKRAAFVITVLSFAGFAINLATHNRYYEMYYSFFTLLALLFLAVSSIIMVVVLIRECLKRNKDAIVIMIGLLAFASTVILEMGWFLLQGQQHRLDFWKWGTIGIIVCSFYVLSRSIYRNFEKLTDYSRQLEAYSSELQKSEQMEMVSHLAASVAHEVKNPLQVTRGFLQLLGGRNVASHKNYMGLAIQELDRAAEIIDGFLDFAKPQTEDFKDLNIEDELQQITSILTPLAQRKGGQIELSAEPIFIKGNSTKLKQALINIVKNSIEALPQDGKIEIFAKLFTDEAVILVKDNGVGMTESELKRIGQPYYTSKENGTGLGLMVTFQIIEAMGGGIEYTSQKGQGTLVSIRFPSANVQKKPLMNQTS
nr:sensor histidine kinase [Paenibacillus protaetiae]